MQDTKLKLQYVKQKLLQEGIKESKINEIFNSLINNEVKKQSSWFSSVIAVIVGLFLYIFSYENLIFGYFLVSVPLILLLVLVTNATVKLIYKENNYKKIKAKTILIEKNEKKNTYKHYYVYKINDNIYATNSLPVRTKMANIFDDIEVYVANYDFTKLMFANKETIKYLVIFNLINLILFCSIILLGLK